MGCAACIPEAGWSGAGLSRWAEGGNGPGAENSQTTTPVQVASLGKPCIQGSGALTFLGQGVPPTPGPCPVGFLSPSFLEMFPDGGDQCLL